MYTVRKWKCSRFWGVYVGEILVTVCVYRRGALALVALLEA